MCSLNSIASLHQDLIVVFSYQLPFSNIFNILFVLGIAASISPVAFTMENLIDIDIEINYVYSTVTIAVDDWDSVETYEFNM